MILTVGNTKGGVGKTTLAVNLTIGLALEGFDVLLIDGDEQGTATAFTELRANYDKDPPGKARYTVVSLHGAAIRSQVRMLASKYDHIVVDVGGRDSGSLRAALTVSNVLLVPCAPRSFDLWGVDQTADLVLEARETNEKLQALAILNGADAQGKDNSEAKAALADVAGLTLVPCHIGRRKAWPNAAAIGLSVLEYWDGNREGCIKAREELACLFKFLYGLPVLQIAEQPHTCIHCHQPAREHDSNGMCMTPDGKTFYTELTKGRL
jgi:chromosome partitioning protein